MCVCVWHCYAPCVCVCVCVWAGGGVTCVGLPESVLFCCSSFFPPPPSLPSSGELDSGDPPLGVFTTGVSLPPVKDANKRFARGPSTHHSSACQKEISYCNNILFSLLAKMCCIRAETGLNKRPTGVPSNPILFFYVVTSFQNASSLTLSVFASERTKAKCHKIPQSIRGQLQCIDLPLSENKRKKGIALRPRHGKSNCNELRTRH